MPRWLYGLLIFTALTVLCELFHVPLPAAVFFLIAALGIIPLAALIGLAVERVAEHTGERVGGLLFATFGNATELIIGIFALRLGLVDVVRASIIGSILGNALLVLGVATFVGTVRVGRLHFATRPASQYASLFALCAAGLVLPTFAELLASHDRQAPARVIQQGVALSDLVAVLLLLGYLASILFSIFRLGDRPGDEENDEFDPVLGERSAAAITRLLAYRHHIVKSQRARGTGVLRQIDSTVSAIIDHETNHRPSEVAPSPDSVAAAPVTAVEGSAAQGAVKKTPDVRKERRPALIPALLLLVAVTVAVGWLSDILVETIQPLTAALHWNAAFVGLIFVPLIGGLPEYFNTINMALGKRMEMVLAASAGSSIQIALLMTPILVLASLAMPVHLDLVFSLVELAVLALAMFLFSEITRDGELVWLEGLLLILLYAMMAGTVFIFGA
jgi:Ca2+:H+ antiporter